MIAETASPTFTQIHGWGAVHLEVAADTWTARARAWENSYAAVLRELPHPGVTPWQGAAANAAARRVDADRRVVGDVADLLGRAASVARSGADGIRAARQMALTKIAAARDAGFDVADDLSIVDMTTPSGAARAQRYTQAVGHARSVWKAADALVAIDNRVAGEIVEAAEGLAEFRFAAASEQEWPNVLLAKYAGLTAPVPEAPNLVYCHPSARPDFWWCEGYEVGGGPYAFGSPFDASGVA